LGDQQTSGFSTSVKHRVVRNSGLDLSNVMDPVTVQPQAIDDLAIDAFIGRQVQ
jgi:hypothetical protein